MKLQVILPALLLAGASAGLAFSQETGQAKNEMVAPGLIMPTFDPARGRELFASKGCVVCHSVNGVGGEDAPPFGANYMDDAMNPFEFAARMWRGASVMVKMQEKELGGQIELNGEELASIIAFVHDADEQAKFSKDDIPEEIAELMEHGHDNGKDHAN